jgi:hypothetical protein
MGIVGVGIGVGAAGAGFFSSAASLTALLPLSLSPFTDLIKADFKDDESLDAALNALALMVDDKELTGRIILLANILLLIIYGRNAFKKWV